MTTFLALSLITFLALYAVNAKQAEHRNALLARYTGQRLTHYVNRIHFSYRYTDKRTVRFALCQNTADILPIADRID